MDEEKIRDIFLSKTCLEILYALDKSHLRPDKLRELVFKKISSTEMLRNKKMRNALIMSISKKEILDLANHLNMEIYNNTKIYKILCNKSFNRNSKNEKKLFEFFDQDWKEFNKIIKPDIETIEPTYSLFDHQNVAIDKIKKYLDGPNKRVLLHMPTGAGKTRTAMRVVSDYFLAEQSTLIIWLAYSEELCEQAIDEFQSTWSHVGKKNIKIYRFFGKHSPDILHTDEINGLIVAGLDKIYNKSISNDLFLTKLADSVTLVVMDEAHQAIAPTYKFVLQQLIEKHDKTKLLGLSATPGRTWNNPQKDVELSNFFNRNKVTLDVGTNPINYLIDQEYIAKPNIIRLEYEDKLTEEDKKKIEKELDIPIEILNKLAQDVGRNFKIITEITKLINTGHKRIIVFAASISNARDISLALHALNYESYYVDGTTPMYIRSSIIKDYKKTSENSIILCNYGVLTAGFDAPNTSAVLIARPTKSLVLYSQMVGRAIRGLKAKGNKECTIITVTDINLPGFRNIVEAFKNWEDVWQ